MLYLKHSNSETLWLGERQDWNAFVFRDPNNEVHPPFNLTLVDVHNYTKNVNIALSVEQKQNSCMDA